MYTFLTVSSILYSVFYIQIFYIQYFIFNFIFKYKFYLKNLYIFLKFHTTLPEFLGFIVYL